MPPSLPDRVRRFGLPPAGLVVAVSGGPDSVALTRAVAAAREPGSPLVLAHLNHQLRGAESDADEAFVVALGASLGDGVPVETHRLDIAAVARAQGGNLEAVARRERYRWLAEVASRHGLAHVATGHTASDQAETVLHRLLRGTGIDGLRGIAARRDIGSGVSVIRPFLGVTREEVVAYLAELGQAARHDASNDDDTLTRNRIRHQLLPLLQRDYNPRIAEALARLAAQAEEVSAAEEALAADLLREAELPRAGMMVVLSIDALRRSPRRVVRGAFRLLWNREGWPRDGMGFVEYERLADLMWSDGGAHDMPGGVHVRRQGAVLQVSGRLRG
jgi:tRNA(Ile)-lysidine synthase